MVQELLLGSDVSFCCGRCRISALTFVGARYMIHQLARELPCGALKDMLARDGFGQYVKTLDSVLD
jgi:hypothetical protein